MLKNFGGRLFSYCLLAEIKRDSEVQEELQKCRDDLKKAQETTEKLLQYMKAMGD